MEDAPELWGPIDELPVHDWPRTTLVQERLSRGDLAGARDVAEWSLDAADVRGDEPSRQILLSMLATVDAHAGRWAEGLAHAREASALAEQLGNATQELALVAWFEAGLGDTDRARADAERALALADDVSGEWSTTPALGTLCVLELSRGLARAGVDWLDELAIDRRVTDGSSVVSIPDLVEALVGVAALDRAVDVAAYVEAPAGNIFLEANALRTRGLILEAKDDLDGAESALQDAVDRYQQLEMPFGAARTLLVLGRVRRRAGRKRRRPHDIGTGRCTLRVVACAAVEGSRRR